MTQGELEALVIRAKARDPEAFMKLMDSQMQVLYKIARSILSNDDDAADAIQDTILTCWEKITALRENGYFKAWSTKILINRCYEIIRENRNVTYVEELPEIPVNEGSDAEWKEALAVLEKENRLIVTLYYVQGFRTKEIAAILGMTDGAVRKRLARAREQLKRYYQEEA